MRLLELLLLGQELLEALADGRSGRVGEQLLNRLGTVVLLLPKRSLRLRLQKGQLRHACAVERATEEVSPFEKGDNLRQDFMRISIRQVY